MLAQLFLPFMLAQHMGNGGGVQTWGIGQIAIAIVVIAAIIGIVLAIVRGFGIPVPGWVWQVVFICLGAFVAILAIRFVLSL